LSGCAGGSFAAF